MPHEILSVKLCELDEKIARLHSRIHLSETAGHERIRAEVESLQNECAETELTLRNKLQFSRAAVVTRLSEFYDEVERIIRQGKEKLEHPAEGQDEDLTVEEKLLLAEYALDFAMQAANRALLTSLRAIEAQMEQQEQKERNM